MISAPIEDTQAILLLCAKLGQRDGSAPALNPRQYTALASWLHERSMRPGNLLHSNGRAQLADLQLKGLDRDRLERLLDRGAVLGLMLERWSRSGIWIVTREDEEYPPRCRSYLQHAAPPILYGVGEQSSLQNGGLAIVGSRHASEEDLAFANRLGHACAEQKIAVISGAAKGIDSESMVAALKQRGSAIGVLADGLGRAAVSAPHHDAILEGRLTLISPYEPESQWFAFTAMERNKLIYALADAAVVVAASDEQGGTWAGAVEALKQGQIPIYVKAFGEASVGNRKIIEAGGQEFPPDVHVNLVQLFNTPPRSSLLFDRRNQPETSQTRETVITQSEISTDTHPDSASATAGLSAQDGHGCDAYGHILGIILDLLVEPLDEHSIAKKLNVLPSKAKAWLKRAVQEGKIEKTRKPVRYVRLLSEPSLFEKEMTENHRS